MRWLAKVIYNWRRRRMCACDSPTFIVDKNILACERCKRAVNWNKDDGFIQEGRRK